MDNRKNLFDEIYSIINDTGIWDYYPVSYDGLTEDILENGEKSKNFISKFLGAGDKLTVKFQIFIDNLSDERAVHIVSTFFLGICIYKNHVKVRKQIDLLLHKLPFIVETNNSQKFAYLWFLITLFHDLGYAIEEGKLDYIKESDTIFLKNRPSSIPEIYTKEIITNYQKYRLCRWNVKDHGIYGAKVFYDEMCKLREENEKKSSNHFWGKELEKIYHLAGWTILCHNIFFITENDPNLSCYKIFNLDDFIGEFKREILLKKHPLLFLFSLVDTIEPLKTLKHLPNLSKVNISFNTDSIEINCKDLCIPFKTVYKDKIYSLDSWLTNIENDTIKL